MALSPKGDALYVASAEGFKDVQGGAVYKLDPTTLKTLGMTHTDLKNFAVQLSPDGSTLYVTNSLDGGISAIDTASGKVKNACCSASVTKRDSRTARGRSCCSITRFTWARWPIRHKSGSSMPIR